MFDVAAIITSRTRIAVLKFFLSNPCLEVGVRECGRRLGLNPMLVRNELLILQRAGLLKCRKVANSTQYSLIQDCSGVKPLQRLLGVS